MKANRWAVINAGGMRDSGSDELQADVMSFMAILGFCLMAIFAIVQSLPLTPQDNRPQLETRSRLHQDIQALEGRLLQMQQQADRQQQNLQTLQQHELQLRQQIGLYTQTLDARLSALVATTDKLSAVETRIAKQQQRLVQLNARLWEGEQTLGSLRRRVRIETRIANEQAGELASLQQQTEALIAPPPEPKAPDKQAAAVATADSALRPGSSATAKKAPPAKTTAASAAVADASQQQGFSLRFDSDSALLQLLNRRTVQLYAMINERTWSFNPQTSNAGNSGNIDSRTGTGGGRFQLLESKKPGLYYEMTAATVPAALVRQIRQTLSVFDPGSVTWGVVLPTAVRGQINSILRQYSSGLLVIDADGRLKREEF